MAKIAIRLQENGCEIGVVTVDIDQKKYPKHLLPEFVDVDLVRSRVRRHPCPSWDRTGAMSDERDDLLLAAWGIIANAMDIVTPPFGPRESGWFQVAENWRDLFHDFLTRRGRKMPENGQEILDEVSAGLPAEVVHRITFESAAHRAAWGPR